MSDATLVTGPALEANIYRLYREFFDLAEKRRRWNLAQDIPWEQCNPNLDPAVADVVESFCAVELFLPDYIGKILPLIRGYRGRAWFAANWGYEESKHSLALGDWLVRSGHRTEHQLRDVEQLAVRHEWTLPMDDVRGMVCYSMVQELSTWLHYRNLRKIVRPQDDPALHTLLGYVSVDERAHFDFFASALELHLQDDRAGTLEQLRRVFSQFLMPAIHMFPDGAERVAKVKALRIFDEEVFLTGVYLPILERLGVSRAEMRTRTLPKKSHTPGPFINKPR
jgi:acyl-[acyl-carrier-protein] desaturase